MNLVGTQSHQESTQSEVTSCREVTIVPNNLPTDEAVEERKSEISRKCETISNTSPKRQGAGISKIKEENKKMIEKQEKSTFQDAFSIFGATKSKTKHSLTFTVYSGTTIYPITKVKVKKSGKFTLIKTNSDCTNRFVQRYPFLYALESAVSADSGTYQWRVIDCKKQEYGGVFILNVIQAVERPMPIGCSIQSTSNDDIGDVQANVITVTEQVGSYLAIPSTEKEQSPPRADSQLQSFQDMDQTDSGANLCSMMLDELLDDVKFDHVVRQLCYLLDPLDNASQNLRWPGLARCFLKVQMDRAYINSIRYHRRGDPDNGPTAFILPSLCSEGYRVGHIVWYFSQPNQRYYEVLKLLSMCHTCDFCNNVGILDSAEDVVSSLV